MAKIANTKLATRNPVACGLMAGIVAIGAQFVTK
jgi:hypothetical protein